MALDSNAMRGAQGILRHFTPYPTPLSAGVNVFAQDIDQELNPYVFPPFSLVHPLLNFFYEQRLHVCTVILPVEQLRPSWWPMVRRFAKNKLVLGVRGDTGRLLYPTKQGWDSQENKLLWDLVAFRMSFVN
jgi:hypothetical protein